MHKQTVPIPENEFSRLLNLSQLNLNYTKLNDGFKDLTSLAAKIAGTEMSLINIIDSSTQWSISGYGTDIGQAPREESICQYTIMSDRPLEISDLTLDDRFNFKNFVKKPSGLRYYYGLPLQISKGISIGALCMIDSEVKVLSSEKTELLSLVAESAVKRIQSFQLQDELQSKLSNSIEANKKVAHDIRGPLSGIIGLSDLMKDLEVASDIQQVMEYTDMINKSSKTLIELTEDILSDQDKTSLVNDQFDLQLFRDNLIELYTPQAKHKNISLEIQLKSENLKVTLPKGKLLQIAGNLVSNAIKFTSSAGMINVHLLIEKQDQLKIVVRDTGVGFDTSLSGKDLNGENITTLGTSGEKGFGLGLMVIYELVKSIKGEIKVTSTIGHGAIFEVTLPQKLTCDRTKQ